MYLKLFNWSCVALSDVDTISLLPQVIFTNNSLWWPVHLFTLPYIADPKCNDHPRDRDRGHRVKVEQVYCEFRERYCDDFALSFNGCIASLTSPSQLFHEGVHNIWRIYHKTLAMCIIRLLWSQMNVWNEKVVLLKVSLLANNRNGYLYRSTIIDKDRRIVWHLFCSTCGTRA